MCRNCREIKQNNSLDVLLESYINNQQGQCGNYIGLIALQKKNSLEIGPTNLSKKQEY